jgi:hypothetical protein
MTAPPSRRPALEQLGEACAGRSLLKLPVTSDEPLVKKSLHHPNAQRIAMHISLKIAAFLGRLGKEKKFSFVSRDPIAYHRHKIDYHRRANLPAAYEYFTRNPCSTVDVQSLRMQLIESRHALHSVRNTLASLNVENAAIPKFIWMYWDKGLQSAPEVVKLSHISWEVQNPDWEVRFLDDNTITQYLDVQSILKLSSIDLTIAHRSDFIRTFLLALHGGVWADSTTFCWRPLSTWLFEDALGAGFFVFRQPETVTDRQIANWFIASSIKNPIMLGMCNELCDYIFKLREVTLTRRSHRFYQQPGIVSRTGTGFPLLRAMERDNAYPYFFYHYLFNEVVATEAASAVWQTVKSARNSFAKKAEELGDVNVSKQTYKGDYVSSGIYEYRKEKLLSLVAPTCMNVQARACFRNVNHSE